MKIIIFNLSGIGNSILFTPALRRLREKCPQAQITFLAARAVYAEPLKGSELVNDIIVFEQKLFRDKLALLWKLRRAKYDYSITVFPSNRWQHNVFAFFVGAKTRITHSYQVAKLRTLSFLQNEKFRAVEDIHDVEQNLKLLVPLGIEDNGSIKNPLFHLLDEDREQAVRFWNENRLEDEFVVGMHPGCSKQNAYKRWPQSSFVELIKKLVHERNAKILLFAGPDEELFVRDIYKQFMDSRRVYLVTRTGLRKVAALISKCDCFICTDSGLGHVAAALGIKTLAILGPTMSTRISPYGKHTTIVRAGIECSPCLKYPFHATHNKIKCDKNIKCLKELHVDTVYGAIESLLNA
jgi:heptosyltransferase-2